MLALVWREMKPQACSRKGARCAGGRWFKKEEEGRDLGEWSEVPGQAWRAPTLHALLSSPCPDDVMLWR